MSSRDTDDEILLKIKPNRVLYLFHTNKQYLVFTLVAAIAFFLAKFSDSSQSDSEAVFLLFTSLVFLFNLYKCFLTVINASYVEYRVSEANVFIVDEKSQTTKKFSRGAVATWYHSTFFGYHSLLRSDPIYSIPGHTPDGWWVAESDSPDAIKTPMNSEGIVGITSSDLAKIRNTLHI